MRLFTLVAMLLLAGCASVIDPYQRAGTWRPNHSNDANLAAMVAVPADLAHGVADDRLANGQDAATAIDRERTGKIYRLPDSGVSTVTPTATGSGAGGTQ